MNIIDLLEQNCMKIEKSFLSDSENIDISYDWNMEGTEIMIKDQNNNPDSLFIFDLQDFYKFVEELQDFKDILNKEIK